MKRLIRLCGWLTALLAAQVGFSGDGSDVRGGATHPVARSAPAANPGRSSLSQVSSAIRPNGNFGRPVAALAQPIRRPSIATNTPAIFRDRALRQTLAFSQPRREVPKAPDGSFQRPVNNRLSYSDALRRRVHERHDCNWWRNHFTVIVFVNSGYYYLDAGYWCPAWGYDPRYDYYDYDGPIYTYGDLLPDQVVVNVQSALQEEGYYYGTITGSLGPATRAALAAYQRDHGLVITGAIDEPTVELLGLD
jgi:Putative peptidoglycan binding domain